MRSVVEVCKWLSTWKQDILGGVDSQVILEYYFTPRSAIVDDFGQAFLTTQCLRMGMDCSKFVFYHADLGPGNIIIEGEPLAGTIGIIEWESAGYYPRGWIRTKFRLSSGMDFDGDTADDPATGWRSRVQMSLGVNGFDDYVKGWRSWRESDA